MESSEREILFLRRVRDLCHLLATQRDVSKLLPLILDAAIELTEAERGYLALILGRKPNGGWKIKVVVARGFDRATLQGTQSSLSRTVVKRVLEGERGLVTTNEKDRDILQVSSVQARRAQSIMCVPMRLRGGMRGVLYLDHRFREATFTEPDLPILQTFADQAALALETAELLAERNAQAERHGETLGELETLRLESVREETACAPSEEDDSTGGSTPSLFGSLVGGSALMGSLYEEIARTARTWDPVLICGESGSGKEVVAREIHARSSRARQPFLAESCAALSDTLLESELFGHTKGAFTGAGGDRQGLFLLAREGTLFLDEVGDMSPAMQGKLLRVLQEGRVRPVGADASLPVACRVLAATHRDLPALVRENKFREDLYYRLDVLRINVPPLRQRTEDILLLLAHFVEQAGRARLELSPKARQLVLSYSWPGNVRELQNEARRLVALGVRKVSARQLSAGVQAGLGVSRAKGALSGKSLAEVEREMVEAALRECKGNKSRAARQLGIPRSTLYDLLGRYELS